MTVPMRHCAALISSPAKRSPPTCGPGAGRPPNGAFLTLVPIGGCSVVAPITTSENDRAVFAGSVESTQPLCPPRAQRRTSDTFTGVRHGCEHNYAASLRPLHQEHEGAHARDQGIERRRVPTGTPPRKAPELTTTYGV